MGLSGFQQEGGKGEATKKKLEEEDPHRNAIIDLDKN